MRARPPGYAEIDQRIVDFEVMALSFDIRHRAAITVCEFMARKGSGPAEIGEVLAALGLHDLLRDRACP